MQSYEEWKANFGRASNKKNPVADLPEVYISKDLPALELNAIFSVWKEMVTVEGFIPEEDAVKQ